ncbi:VanZ family protein [Halomonas campisalis]|uniref:VanZ family protein n=1 Tax=Billgrantia campisalis TaxID=74661 RepID=A0ABS9P4W9_9GAMM|nr:VanZ family protein [Halomonas campisalis]MCG6656825.1 VanZ family protein [Halomonas campisalis]MDR5862014.1 VanZ family protein [Halomonas campisalis]
MPETPGFWRRLWYWCDSSDRHRLWAVLAVVAALLIAVGSLTPGSEMPETLPWDKFNHFVGYGGLAGLAGLAGVRLPIAFVGVVLYGIVIEYLQIPVPGRSGGDWADIFANTLGAGTAALVLYALRHHRAGRRD